MEILKKSTIILAWILVCASTLLEYIYLVSFQHCSRTSHLNNRLHFFSKYFSTSYFPTLKKKYLKSVLNCITWVKLLRLFPTLLEYLLNNGVHYVNTWVLSYFSALLRNILYMCSPAASEVYPVKEGGVHYWTLPYIILSAYLSKGQLVYFPVKAVG